MNYISSPPAAISPVGLNPRTQTNSAVTNAVDKFTECALLISFAL